VVSRWRRGPEDRSFTLTAGGPVGTAGTVYVPLLGHRCTIARDGQVVTPKAIISGYARFDDVHGVHTWAWDAACQQRHGAHGPGTSFTG
jgi:hypothetical protein